MNFREAIGGVALYAYDHRRGRGQPAQQHLIEVRRQLQSAVPVGMRLLVSGSGQSLPIVPWIAILDPDVTQTAQEGMYVVYLYRRDLSQVYLTMNQGATQHRRYFADQQHTTEARAEHAAVAELQRESALVREQLGEGVLAGLATEIELGAPNYFLPKAYEAGTIAAISYDPRALPADHTLEEDLSRFLAMYDSCVQIKDQLLVDRPGTLHTATSAARARLGHSPALPHFRPKSSAEYTAEVPAQHQTRGRRHEKLVKEFGLYLKALGLEPNTNVHPRDLTVAAGPQEWLVEAKIVAANAELSVREAIGQLLAYRHFYYRERREADPQLVAVFSENPGPAFIDLLQSVDIDAAWRVKDGWQLTIPQRSQVD